MVAGKSAGTILVASHNPQLADVRKQLLENAGYVVIPASNILEVRSSCIERAIDLVVIGYSVPPAAKRQIWAEVRNHCNIPILELHNGGPAELADESRIFTHQSETPIDFLQTVQSILAGRASS